MMGFAGVVVLSGFLSDREDGGLLNATQKTTVIKLQITILVAAEGVHKLPVINGSADLNVALQKLGSIPANKTLAVEVLWTPQDENDTLTERELLEDYPLLRPL